MKEYLDLCKEVLRKGNNKSDRTGTGTVSIFGYQMRYDLSKGFPLVTTKDMMVPNSDGVTRLDMIIEELIWFLKGDTRLRTLLDKKINIWNRDAYKNYLKYGGKLTYKSFLEKVRTDYTFSEIYGDLGSIYGKQWRSWEVPVYEDGFNDGTMKEIDQIANVIESLKNDPDSRRHIVSAWNVGDLDKMALPPCHTLFQFYIADGKLSCQLYQRSGDIFLGVPFNIASYSLLTMLIAEEVGLEYGEFIHTIGDAHIYNNHIDQMIQQIVREPRPLPKLTIVNKKDSIFDYVREDFVLEGYDPHPELKGAQSS